MISNISVMLNLKIYNNLRMVSFHNFSSYTFRKQGIIFNYRTSKIMGGLGQREQRGMAPAVC
jgi:hypothetical protein